MFEWASQVAQQIKNLPVMQETQEIYIGSILGLGRCCGGGHGNLLLYSCLENHRQRSLAGCSP